MLDMAFGLTDTYVYFYSSSISLVSLFDRLTILLAPILFLFLRFALRLFTSSVTFVGEPRKLGITMYLMIHHSTEDPDLGVKSW